jgi:hypothetical protein
MPFVLVADLVAQARDEDGMPVLPVFVHGPIEEWGKRGVIMRGRPVDATGEPRRGSPFGRRSRLPTPS